MTVTVDIGNSNIVTGIWDDDTLVTSWRIHTVTKKTTDEYSVIFRSLFTERGILPDDCTRVCISSVVPSLTAELCTMLAHFTGCEPIVVGPVIYPKLPVTIVNPYEIGSDLVANSLAAYLKSRGACVVVDFGTALTFTAVDPDGNIQGVAIAPGLNTAVNALSRDTAQLPQVELAIPPAPFGKNTVHAIQAGIVYGYTGMVEYMVQAIAKEMGTPLQVIATGGLCNVIAPLTKVFTTIEPNLTLHGLKLIADIISEK